MTPRLIAAFGPRLVAPTETLEMIFPIRFDKEKFAGEKAIECAIGMGAGKYFAKRPEDRPKPN